MSHPLEALDHAYAAMIAAAEGDPLVWRRVNEGLRDLLLDHALRVSPYYREVVPRDGGWSEVPVLTKAVIRERLPDLVARGVPPERLVPKRTSGSSGEPLAFYRDAAQGPIEEISAQRFLRRLHGISDVPTKVWIASNPRAPEPPWPDRDPAQPLVRPVTAAGLTPSQLRDEVRAWGELSSYFVYGPASALDLAARVVLDLGLEVPGPPVAAVTTADALTPDAEERIGRALGCPVHSWYGSHELNGFVAGTIPGSRRYAVNPLLVHMEILGEDGRPVPPGRPGRLVFTDLNNFAMPLIRYEIGDVAAASDGGWGGFPLMEELVGRSSEVLSLPSGRSISPTTLGQLLFVVRDDLVERVVGYQCAQTGPNELELRIVWRSDPDEAARAAAADAVRAAADPETRVRVVDVDRLETLPSGKAWVTRHEW